MTERVLVTGAAGFIGAHTCRVLLDAGYDVVGVDNFDPFYDRRLKEAAVRELRATPGFSFVEADVRDRERLTEPLRRADVVVHLAARAGVRPSIVDPETYVSINVDGTAAVLETCRAAGIGRVVFGSSSSVYGDTTPVPFREDAPAMDPISPYAATKRAGELLCQVHSRLHEARIAALRFFTVYGPRQRPDLAIHRFTRHLAMGQPIQQYGDGSSERDYTHTSDIVEGVLSAVQWTAGDRPLYDVFNLGQSRTVRLDYLIQLIAESLGVRPLVERLPEQPGDVVRTHADISKARRELGYDPQMAIEDGIAAFVAWYKETYGREAHATA